MHIIISLNNKTNNFMIINDILSEFYVKYVGIIKVFQKLIQNELLVTKTNYY